ncbi:DUF4279 domain-containing protein [Bathymodiolus thermophilus thioautotrophic gill symbiont]|uniref:DUF4279 domain-containing protein n=1 Tax=Bathymodiolus thermophilus thioautotrophic gill symbiont TaxID=2360 RepID=UPI000A058E42
MLNIDLFKVRQKGDNIGSHTFYKEISWEYIFESCDWHLDDGTSFILEVFADKINKFKKDNNLHYSISVEYYIHDSITPALFLEQKILKFLLDLNCAIEFDGYVL